MSMCLNLCFSDPSDFLDTPSDSSILNSLSVTISFVSNSNVVFPDDLLDVLQRAFDVGLKKVGSNIDQCN